MAAVSCALALIGGIIGAGFASGREIVRFFAGHGGACAAAVVSVLIALPLLFLRLSAQMEAAHCSSLPDLCRLHFGLRFGRLCTALFFALFALTGGAMLAACAELCALTVNLHHAHAMGMALTACLGFALARRGASAPALPGAILCALLPALLLRLWALPQGEACFFPAQPPLAPLHAIADGAIYAALNTAMLAGNLPMLLSLDRRARRHAALLFTALFGALLALSVLVCRRHLAFVWHQPLPLVALSQSLGRGGYLLVAACLYAAAFSTFLSMVCAMAHALPRSHGAALGTLLCFFVACAGFSALVETGYPTLGLLCAGLLLLLCFAPCLAKSEMP